MPRPQKQHTGCGRHQIVDLVTDHGGQFDSGMFVGGGGGGGGAEIDADQIAIVTCPLFRVRTRTERINR